MKTLRYAIPTVIFVLLFIPSAIFAQDASAEPIDVTSALDVIRTEYGEDILILEAEYDSKDDENETTCWEIEFEVTNADATSTNVEAHVCPDAETSNLVIVLDEDENGDDDNDNDEQAFSAPTISIDEAIATTLETVADGVITSIELENDASVLVWVFELEASPNVYISADSGDVIEFADSDADGDDDSDDDDDSDENHDDDDEDSNEDHDDDDDSDEDDD